MHPKCPYRLAENGRSRRRSVPYERLLSVRLCAVLPRYVTVLTAESPERRLLLPTHRRDRVSSLAEGEDLKTNLL
jgi:hypothetical protein